MLILHTLLISTLMLTTAWLQSMENPAEFALRSENYNEKYCPLIHLLKRENFLFQNIIFNHFLGNENSSSSALESNIKNYIKASGTCKYFYRFMTFNADEHCYENSKNRMLYRLIFFINDLGGKKAACKMALMLIQAGANPNMQHDGTSILEAAVKSNDEELIATLLKHNAKSDAKNTTITKTS
jgi:hypothetical protein